MSKVLEIFCDYSYVKLQRLCILGLRKVNGKYNFFVAAFMVKLSFVTCFKLRKLRGSFKRCVHPYKIKINVFVLYF